jgi:capsular polysaccharide biosynthesis protein
MATLQPLGFEMVCPGHMSFREQAAVFSTAEIVVAVHGAALTNLVYAGHCRAMIELFPADSLKTTYMRLAERIGADYHPCLGGVGDRHQSFSIEPGLLLEAVEKAVGSVSAPVVHG